MIFQTASKFLLSNMKKSIIILLALFITINCFAQLSVKVPVTIDRTGSHDVTSELISFLAGVPDSSIIDFPVNGKYRVEGTLQLLKRNDLVINGNCSLIFATTAGNKTGYASRGRFPDRTRSQWSLENCDNITLRNFVIKGANPNGGPGENAYVSALEAQHAFNIVGSTNVLIQNNIASDVYGDFVYIGGTGTQNITVKGNRFEKNGRQGIAVSHGENILIDSNYLRYMRRSVIDIEANTDRGIINNVRITHNDLGASRLLLFANGGQSYHINNIYFAHNIVAGGSGGIQVLNKEIEGKRGPYTFEYNTFFGFRGSPSPVFKVIGAKDVIMRNNSISVPVKRKMTAIRLVATENAKISGNTFNGAIVAVAADSTNVKVFQENNRLLLK